jgi:signal transduction histidine kinase
MRRLLPVSLGGQLGALLIVALLAAHLVSLFLFWRERSDAIEAAAKFGLVDRIAALIEVIDEASPELGDRLAAALSSYHGELAIASQSALPPDGMNSAEVDFARDLAEQLSLRGAEPRVRFMDLAPSDRIGREHHRRGLTNVIISIPLAEGRWLNASSRFRTPSIGWSLPWLASLAGSAVLTLVVVTLLVRRITGPMRALAAAAEKVGRGEAVDPVPIDGPSEVRTTVKAFNAMQQRLSRFVSDRTRMVAAISHDLRTPITSLRLRAEFIEDEELKRDIVRTLDEMQAMADATLAFARDEGSGEETRSVDLAALIDGVVQDQRELGREVVYCGPERLVWRCRPVGLRRAITNLIDNAARYAGPCSVRLSEAGGEVVIAVEDAGPGIPEARLADVFEPFVRLETSRSRETGGAGLGLAIARSIARAHGGELMLANRGEGGLAATINLP